MSKACDCDVCELNEVKKQRDDLLVAAKSFLSDYLEYIDTDDYDLPDCTELKNLIESISLP